MNFGWFQVIRFSETKLALIEDELKHKLAEKLSYNDTKIEANDISIDENVIYTASDEPYVECYIINVTTRQGFDFVVQVVMTPDDLKIGDMEVLLWRAP